MFVARVLVGHYTRGNTNFVHPPAKTSVNGFYDSCVDNETNPTIFVIFENSDSDSFDLIRMCHILNLSTTPYSHCSASDYFSQILFLKYFLDRQNDQATFRPALLSICIYALATRHFAYYYDYTLYYKVYTIY
uniref:PARP catalytic domain-containing protein n=1 Tax=Electrophorus electricus TaxID=8005 RepID=A0A4W4GNP4_ELEEL